MDKRTITQLLFSIGTNANIKGFLEGKIYTGKTKSLCVPGLNCYSCPGALGSCPIGSLQAVIGSIKYKFSFYVIGFISLMGVLFGRLICGWLCPFGFIQDLLHKIPTKKVKIIKGDKILRYLKYVILALFVILLPLVLADELGISDPYFCKFICPVGTLEGGIPLVLTNPALRSTIGFLYAWKMILLLITILAAILIYRPFCKYICPLGAIYSVFNPISFYKLKVNTNACNKCGKCSKVCEMNVNVYEKPNSLECIRCNKCKKACPQGAIRSSFSFKDQKGDSCSDEVTIK
ncbi:4Fe-4S ferredoxin iron-sulfur binding domain-containing protein [Gottschalkia purinilytica]|uniref:4Fe-4S ferredoxin iron-sulfur binding domain-containing protein n=1 Tax=Gottschalkia purinilytica TaxID=1503 RepID=A0A0L0W8H4_GOTPU|nr:4Fe-4S binding protein [Gottschalkia purinilytica]KNF07751.1 4Fe-4S ferredoxin iron-sulfur binding domain-containing protein [Gottschalkia purinilytica]